jgi:hypothetical protein
MTTPPVGMSTLNPSFSRMNTPANVNQAVLSQESAEHFNGFEENQASHHSSANTLPQYDTLDERHLSIVLTGDNYVSAIEGPLLQYETPVPYLPTHDDPLVCVPLYSTAKENKDYIV